MWSPTHVQIIVQRARNVIPKGRNGTNDSYAIIQNGKEKFQTSVKEQSIDPIWHEECDLLLENKETDVIKLIVFHRNLFGLADEFLGQAFVPLKDFDIYERPKSRWYELDGRSLKKTKKYRGEIEVRVTFIVKNIPNEKIKKKNSLVHHSLLDIRGALKSDSKSDKYEPKNISSGRKHSMADSVNRGSKLATRSISFKLESINNRRKSLVDKFLRRHDSVSHESEEEYNVEEESQDIDDNDVIIEEMSKSEEEVRQLGKNTDNKIVIEVKNDLNSGNNSQQNNDMKIDTKLRNKEVINGLESKDKRDNEAEVRSISEKKSSSWKPFKGSLKRAFSTSNLSFMPNPSTTPVVKPVPKLRSSAPQKITGSIDNLAEKLPQLHSRQNNTNINNNNKTSIVTNGSILRQTPSNRDRILSALKNSERRHTIDIERLLPNLRHPSVVLEKRATQASPDSLYSSFESLINRKHTKTDYHQKYEGLNKEELIQLIESQQLTIFGLNEQINDLEDYIDNLLVRVIETSPRLLQNANDIHLKSLFKI